jgi:hypothetical protein
MKEYFTFGSDHRRDGKSLGRYYVEVEAEEALQARRLMMAVFADQWCAQYTETEFAKHKTKYQPMKYMEININKIGVANDE